MSTPTHLPWWRTDTYDVDEPVPPVLNEYAGPEGVALVRAWPSGVTDPGWGLRRDDQEETEGFMYRYTKKNFVTRRVLPHYYKGNPIALIMRSLSMICVDIDGKNNGFTTAMNLGVLTPTLAETSKSGNGYHLFYLTDEQWDETSGFSEYQDRISLYTGIDIRATGCVYHYPTQRWNAKAPSMIPEGLSKKLKQHRDNARARSAALVQAINTSEDHEVLMMQTDLIDQLKQSIPQGKRNNTLFAIGSQMKLAQVEGWEELIHQRALAVGLDNDEASKLVNNIATYA